MPDNDTLQINHKKTNQYIRIHIQKEADLKIAFGSASRKVISM